MSSEKVAGALIGCAVALFGLFIVAGVGLYFTFRALEQARVLAAREAEIAAEAQLQARKQFQAEVQARADELARLREQVPPPANVETPAPAAQPATPAVPPPWTENEPAVQAPTASPAQPQATDSAWEEAVKAGFTLAERISIPLNAPGMEVHFPATHSPFVFIHGGYGADARRELWDLRTGQRSGALTGIGDMLRPVCISPDGKFLAGGSGISPTVRVWSFATGKQECEFQFGERGSSPQILQFIGPSELLLHTSLPNKLSVWSARSGQQLREIAAPQRMRAEQIAIRGDGARLAVVDEHRAVRILDLKSGQAVGDFPYPKQGSEFWTPVGLSFSPDGAEIAGVFQVANESRLLSWDLESGEIQADHRFDARLKFTVAGASMFRGPEIQWLADGRGWLIHGHSVVDRDQGGPVWNFPPADAGSDVVRRPVDAQRLLSTTGPHGSRVLEITAIPHDKIKAAAKIVASGGEAIDADLPPLTTGDWSMAKTLSLRRGPDQWQVPLAPATLASELTTRPVRLSSRPVELRSILLPRSEPAKVITFSAASTGLQPLGRLDRGRPARWVDHYDLRSGRNLGSLDLTFDTELVAVSPDGATVLTRIAKGQDRLDLWSLSEGKHKIAWRPYQQEKREDRSVSWAALLDGNRCLTVSKAGKLALWQLPECRVVYSVADIGNQAPVLSPSGKHLLAFDGKTFEAIDAADGTQTGKLTEPASTSGLILSAAAFRADGTRLAALVDSRGDCFLVVWDLATGEIDQQFPVPATGKGIFWCGDDNVLLESGTLVDLKRHTPVWHYELKHGKHVAGSPDGKLWYAAASDLISTLSLCGANLPDEQAREHLDLSAELLPVVAPKGAVSIDVEIKDPHPEVAGLRSQVTKLYEGQLRLKGIEVAADKPIAVLVTVEEEKTDKALQVRLLGGFGFRRPPSGLVIVPVTRLTAEVAFVDNQGETLWSREFSTETKVERYLETIPADREVPEFLYGKQWLAAQKFLESVQLPAYVFPAGAEKGLGESVLAPGGIEPLRIKKRESSQPEKLRSKKPASDIKA